MATKISWTHFPDGYLGVKSWKGETWNPTSGCTKVSPGCAHCYAERQHERFNGKGSFATVTVHPDRLDKPLGWKKPRSVFVNSMSDLFHKDVPNAFIEEVFARMAVTPRHTYQILTKRPERMRKWLSTSGSAIMVAGCAQARGYRHLIPDVSWEDFWPLPNVWLGVSAENQAAADERIPLLLDTPAAVRFLSAEPLLGPIDLTNLDLGDQRTRGYGMRRITWDALTGWEHQSNAGMKPEDPLGRGHKASVSGPDRRIDWIIAGGESGPGARFVKPSVNACQVDASNPRVLEAIGEMAEALGAEPPVVEWMRSIRDQCAEAGVPFFAKQLGAKADNFEALPRDLQRRAWPR